MPRRPTPTIDVAVTQFIADHVQRHTRGTSVRDYRSLLHRFSDAIGGGRRVGSVQPEAVTDWLYGFVRRGCAPATVNKYRQRIMTFNRWCREHKYTKHDWLASLPAEPETTRDWVQFTPAQLLRLLEAATHPRDRIMLAVAMNTGLRISEIISLHTQDVDLNHNRLRVKISKQRGRGEMIDYMPITLDLRNELTTWLDAYAEACGPLQDRWYLTPAKNRDYILSAGLSEETHKPRTNHGHLKPEVKIHEPQPILRRIFDRAGYVVPSGEAWHVLRRSVALIYFHSSMEQGDPYADALKRTSALLHHKSGQTTERYLGLSSDREARDADLAGQPFLSRLSEAGRSVPRRLRAIP